MKRFAFCLLTILLSAAALNAQCDNFEIAFTDFNCDEDSGEFVLLFDVSAIDPLATITITGTGIGNPFPFDLGELTAGPYPDGTTVQLTFTDDQGCIVSWSSEGPVACTLGVYHCSGNDGFSENGSVGDTCTDPHGVQGQINFNCECDPSFVLSFPPFPSSSLGSAFADRLTAKVSFEGFMLSDGTMHTQLVDNGLLPLSQPFGGAPYFYNGTESISTIPENTVDWVLVEFRNPLDISIVEHREAALVNKFGEITTVGGQSGLVIPVADNPTFNPQFRLVIRHPGHLAIAHKTPIINDSSSYFSDGNYLNFTYSPDAIFGENQIVASNGTFLMRAGDFDDNGTINFGDFINWLSLNNNLNTYSPVDVDGNGTVNFGDFILWLSNNNALGHQPIWE